MKTNVPPEQEASPQGTSPEAGASPALTKTQAARRRILGATLGAPVIYTLPSGALQAASSSLCEDDLSGNSAIQNVTVNQNKKVYDGSTEICKLDNNDGTCEYNGRTWVYTGTEPSGNASGNGTLVTHSCWTSMGTSASLIGTNWSNLG